MKKIAKKKLPRRLGETPEERLATMVACLKLKAEPMPVAKIAEHFQVSFATVQAWIYNKQHLLLREAALDVLAGKKRVAPVKPARPRRRRLPVSGIKAAVRLYDDGLGLQQAAERAWVPMAELQKALRAIKAKHGPAVSHRSLVPAVLPPSLL